MEGTLQKVPPFITTVSSVFLRTKPPNLMIIDFTINYKSYNKEVIKNINFFTYICPKCGAKHSWNRHATYERHLVIQENNMFIDTRITILRLKCTSCHSTHAILPVDIIPYVIHSLSCVVKLLVSHYVHNESVLSLATKYGLSFQLIYSFLQGFLSFINSCYLTLRTLLLLKGTIPVSPSTILMTISQNFSDSDYQQQHSKLNQWPFLMHRLRDTLTNVIFIGLFFSHN